VIPGSPWSPEFANWREGRWMQRYGPLHTVLSLTCVSVPPRGASQA
jgi:hypothetical protein